MSHRFSCAVLALAMIVAGAATRADAQGLTGQISGVVTDTGGGVMPGATVTIKNVGTNLDKETVTGADGAFVFPDLLAGTFDLTVNVQGFKSYEQKGIVARRDRARRAARHRARGRRLEETVTRRQRGDARADDQRRAFGGSSRARTSRTSRSRAATSPACSSSCRASSTRARAKRRAGAACSNLTHQRPRLVQLLVRRRHQQGHRVEQRQLRRAGARLDRRSARPGVELPGRVRPQLRRDDHGHHPQRHQGLPRQRGVLQARRRLERQRVLAPAAVRPGQHGAVRAAALHVRQHGVDARRPGARSRAPSSTRAATSCSSSGRRTSCRAPTRATLNQRRMPTALERAAISRRRSTARTA